MSELSLLVIDLGDSCVVKVEKGDVSQLDLPLDSDRIISNSWIYDGTFTDIRAAIDALADEPPVPRIERTFSKGLKLDYDLISQNEIGVLSQEDYDALSELAGKSLPVYEPRKGEWKQIDAGHKRFSAWIYTRGGK